MDTIGFSDVLAIVIGIISFLMFATVLIRLRRLINTTLNMSLNAVADHYYEAKILEATNDKNGALQSYYRCYTAMRSIGFRSVKVFGGTLNINMIKDKIESLGGEEPKQIISLDSNQA